MKKQLPMHTVSAAGFIINDNKLLLVHNPLKGWETSGGIIQEGESVLDPFMGLATTGISCVKYGKDFTGIEIYKDYYDIAKERMNEATQQMSLFG